MIYAHPNPKSLNTAVLDHVESGLKERGVPYKVVDLYKDNFNPVLVIHDERKRRDMMTDSETANYRELIGWADHLIFIYPVWWYGAPAILKGFFDRVLASGFAYEYEGLMPRGLLKGKSAWGIYTIVSPKWYVKVWRRRAE